MKGTKGHGGPMGRTIRSSGMIFLLFAVAVTLVSSSAEAKGAAAYPNSIVVLGHSGATGYDSDPARPRVDIRANSWATGTNPAVKSVYQRLLALNPKIRGHNLNLAKDGGVVRDVLAQAAIAVKSNPRPELVLIQIMDNDMRCPDVADPKPPPTFQPTLEKALQLIAKATPKARIFVVSQFGSPGTNVAALTAAQRKANGGGSGPCDFLDANGKIIPSRLAHLETEIHAFEAALAVGCKTVSTCRYDGGAFGRVVDRPEYISKDLSHFSIKGHAKAAAVAWEALKRTGSIPNG